MREIAIDTETTGLSYKNGDRIIELGCVELVNYVSTGNTLNFYCKVNKKISTDAKKITGISDEFLSDKQTFEEQHLQFLNFIKNDKLVIHNADFDLGFLNNELKLIGKQELQNEVIDTVKLARKTLNTRIANLDYLCRHYNIDLSNRKQHGALLDAQLLAEVYLELRGGKQITMRLESESTSKSSTDNQKQTTTTNTIKIKVLEKENNLHKSLVKKIKEPIWNKYEY